MKKTEGCHKQGKKVKNISLRPPSPHRRWRCARCEELFQPYEYIGLHDSDTGKPLCGGCEAGI